MKEQKDISSNSTGVNSQTKDNHPKLDSKTPKLNRKHRYLVNWFGNSNYIDINALKWIILSLEESKSNPDIKKGMNVIMNELNEIHEAGIKKAGECIVYMEQFKSCLEKNFEKDLSDQLRKKIFLYLHIEDSSEIPEEINSLNTEQRSVLRFMVHQRIQAWVAFIRTTFKIHNKCGGTESYHCTFNPYYFKERTKLENKNKELKQGLDETKNENMKLEQKLNEIKRENEKLKQGPGGMNKGGFPDEKDDEKLSAKNDERINNLSVEQKKVDGEKEKKINDLSLENKDIKNQLQKSKREEENTKNEAAQYQSQLSEKEKKINNLSLENKDIKNQLQKSKREEENAKNETAQYLSQLSEKEKKINDLSLKNKDIMNQLQISKRGEENAKNEAAQYRSQLSEKEKKINDLSLKNKDIKNQLQKSKREEENAKKAQYRSQLFLENKDIKDQLQKSKREEEDAKNEAAQYRSQLSEKEKNINDLSLENEDIKNQLQKSKREEKNAKNEAAQYQSQLGSAIDTRSSSIQLKNDINELQQKVEHFVQVKGRNFEITEDAPLELLKKYGYKVKPVNIEMSSFLNNVLQRLVLEDIFDEAETLLKDKHLNDPETSILHHTNELIKYTNEFSNIRNGEDIVTDVIPIKIRQQIHAALASRGFSNPNSPFVNNLSSSLLTKMEKYRKVLSDVKKERLQDASKELVRLGIRVWLRLRTQEPEPKIKWIRSGEELKSHLMEGPWDVDEMENLEVEFCRFPAILVEENSEIFNKADVLTRKKEAKQK